MSMSLSNQGQFAQNNCMRLAEAVFTRRLELGLSLKEAAAEAGLTPDQWAAIESGEWVPDMETLKGVAMALDCCWVGLTFVAEIARYWQSLPTSA